MKIAADLEVGAATHTGCVRRTNEDDYLLLIPDESPAAARYGRLIALADGMGGVTGGAEASRTAIRALSQSFLGVEDELDSPKARMLEGFRRASHRVCEISRESPALRGMGTTLTAMNLVGNRVLIGHVGDTRCYRLRDGELQKLTEDHAVRGAENRLTRCIGGGRLVEDVDLIEEVARPGDQYLLASDGLWELVDDGEIRRVLAGSAPQEAADELVRLANAGGGPDNNTAVVIRIVQPRSGRNATREVVLPAEESQLTSALPTESPTVVAARWPWFLLAVSFVLSALAVAKEINGIDFVGPIVQFFAG